VDNKKEIIYSYDIHDFTLIKKIKTYTDDTKEAVRLSNTDFAIINNEEVIIIIDAKYMIIKTHINMI
jgi:hypothetical protein